MIRRRRPRVCHWRATKASGVAVIAAEAAAAGESDVLRLIPILAVTLSLSDVVSRIHSSTIRHGATMLSSWLPGPKPR
jgi:hypothetical protein